MRKLFYVILILVIPIFCNANDDDWVSINGTLRENYEVNQNSIKKSSYYIKVWVKLTPYNSEAKAKSIKEYLSITPVNNKYKRYAYTKNIIFNTDYYDMLKFHDVVPDSGAESILEFVCSHLPD
jgi:hypothetical protein